MPAAVATRLALVAVLIVGAVSFAPPARGADPGGCWPTAFRCHALDELRADAGLAGFDQDRDLQDYAETWSEHMAATGVLEHSGGPYSECVGFSDTWSDVFAAFMDSPEHRAIILDGHLTDVGIGAQRDGERVWITLVFR